MTQFNISLLNTVLSFITILVGPPLIQQTHTPVCQLLSESKFQVIIKNLFLKSQHLEEVSNGWKHKEMTFPTKAVSLHCEFKKEVCLKVYAWISYTLKHRNSKTYFVTKKGASFNITKISPISFFYVKELTPVISGQIY